MNRMSLGLILTASLCSGLGCANQNQRLDMEIVYAADQRPLAIQPAVTAGDFALYYGGQDKPEVPVRVSPGDPVGFIDEGGRLKAVAGPFRMDISPDVREAVWKRLNDMGE